MSAELRQMLRLAPLVLAQLDLDGRFVDLEGRLLGDLGLHPAEMIGRLATELFSDAPMIDGGGNPLQLDRILERVKSGERMTAIIQLSFRWLETVYSPVQSTGGEVSGMLSITTDVTERNLLRAERQRYFTMTRDLLCIAGMDGYFRMVNPSFERVLGYSSEELTSRKFLDFVHPDDLALTLAEIDKLRGGAMTLSFDNRYVAKDGEVHDLSWTSVADVVAGVLYATARDVTETKKLRASLALNDRLAAVGSLAAGVAHEINNPLAYVVANLGFAVAQLSSVQNVDLDEVRAALREAQDGTDRVKRITRDLKVFARGDEDRISAIEVRPVFESAMNMAWNEIRHRARLVKALDAVPLVDANASRLAQVMLNLLLNAAQAIPAGAADANTIKAATRMLNGKVAIEVTDSGTGIAPEHLTRLFEPFFTTKPVGVGTGLGLSICHGIVSGFGGTIEAISEVGKGTTFRILLPVGTSRLAAPVAPVAALAPIARRRILAIDDEPLLATCYSRMLRAEHDVVTATDAREALARITRGERFDVIFCDLMMPVMGGMEFYAAVKALTPELLDRIVFVTGGAFTLVAREFLEGVSNLRLEKPFEMSTLKAVVHDRAK